MTDTTSAARATRGDAVPPWSLAIIAMLLIQVSNALSVTVIEVVGAAGTSWLRMCFGALFLLLIVRPSLRRLRRADLPMLLALGTITGLMTTFFLAALDRIPLGTAVAIEFLGPLSVAAVTSRRRQALVWPALALAGVVLLTEPWRVGATDLLGVVFAVLAGTCWALYNLLTQRVGDRFSGITGLAYTIPIAAVVTTVIGLQGVVAGAPALPIILLAAGIALITPVISFGLEMLALRRMTHTAFGTLLAIEPAFGLVIGLIVLSQAPGVWQLVGIAIVVAAGAAAQRRGRRVVPPTV